MSASISFSGKLAEPMVTEVLAALDATVVAEPAAPAPAPDVGVADVVALDDLELELPHAVAASRADRTATAGRKRRIREILALGCRSGDGATHLVRARWRTPGDTTRRCPTRNSASIRMATAATTTAP